MGAIILILVVVIIIAVSVSKRSGQDNHDSNSTGTPPRTIRCPNCGSPATVKGSQWECGYCGDFGNLK